MKDYLNADEKNQLMVFMSILQVMDGNRGINGPKIVSVLEDWSKRKNLTKEEHKNLKYANTYLSKFCESVYNRLNDKEQKQLDKRLKKFDFRLVDDYTLQKVYRDMSDRMQNAVVPREQFNNWCEEIMERNCNECNKDWKECRLHEVFENNFVPESSWGLDNCRYAYKDIEKEKAI
ncbi:hypothetical protein KYB31_15580 [Clostridium felsineum]|uniref:DUF5651 domain-containing protein n=1 Tax=Clostridium felsineum TaxID=36839 RepID=UPI00214D7EFD|nr:DUF5651 domain-containing protein [Clostridium felsineum]MCR3760398.1 hypothetical protein [Clostridium felsineum]